MKIKDPDDIILLSVAMEAMVDSMIVSKVSLEHLVDNNGKGDNPNYPEVTLGLIRDEIAEIDIALTKANVLKEKLDKEVELLQPGIKPPNWNG